MKKIWLAVATLLAIVMVLGTAGTAFATSYELVDPDDQGKTGIVGGDTLAFPENTVWANLTARWGVRVIFQDDDKWDNAEFQNQLLHVTESAHASTTAPADPSHAGYRFVGWKRVDANKGPSTLSDDGSVKDINGPGPIIYQAQYEQVGQPVQTDSALGGLTVTKTVTGNAASKTQRFTFTVTLSDKTISGKRGGMTFREGAATFELKDGESMSAEGLPVGVRYSVVESNNAGYEVTMTGNTGTIKANVTAKAAFTNSKNVTGTQSKRSGGMATPKTGDEGSAGTMGVLLLALLIDVVAIVALRTKWDADGRLLAILPLLLVGTMAVCCLGAPNAYAAEGDAKNYTYGQYDMVYLPGTTDVVSNMPDGAASLTPGMTTPYTVSSTIPERKGFEFIDWTLAWGSMAKPTPLTSYVVEYISIDTLQPIAAEKHVANVEIGSTVTESAIDIEDYVALEPSTLPHTMDADPSKNVITFYYEESFIDY